MFILATVTKWSSIRDGGGRVTSIDRPQGRVFLLNPQRIEHLRPKGTGTKFLWHDNPQDPREGGSYIESTISLSEIEHAINTDSLTNFISLPLYINNDITDDTINYNIPVDDISFVDQCNYDGNACWVVYLEDSFRKKKVLCGLSLYAILSLINGNRIYYVKNGGDDNLDGLTDDTAWAHHPWMLGWTGIITLAPGDTVYFNRGDTWENITDNAPLITINGDGAEGEPITMSSYGTGNLPLLHMGINVEHPVIFSTHHCYLLFEQLEITHWSGLLGSFGTQNGIWFYNRYGTSHDIIIKDCVFHDIPYNCINFDGTSYNIVVGDSTAVACATPTNHSNEMYDFGYCGAIFSGCNPSTLKSDFYLYYNYIHDTTNKNPLDNYGMSFGPDTNTALYPKYAYCRYNYVKNFESWHALDTHGGSYQYFEDNYLENFQTGIALGGVICGTQQILDHIYIKRNTIVIDPTNPLIIANPGSFIRMEGTQYADITPTYLEIKDNILTCSPYPTGPITTFHGGILIATVNTAEISGNKLTYNPAPGSGNAAIWMINGSYLFGSKNVVIKNNFIYDYGSGIFVSGVAVDGQFDINNNIIIGADSPVWDAVFKILTTPLKSTAILNINNNTFLAGPTMNYVFDADETPETGSVLIVKNNILGSATTHQFFYILFIGTLGSGTVDFDNNLYWNSTFPLPIYIDGVTQSWSYWLNTCLQEAHTPNITQILEPEFINAGGSYLLDSDYDLRSSSPAIEAGVDVGLTDDYSGRPILGLPDIGAKQFYVPCYLRTTHVYDTRVDLIWTAGIIQDGHNIYISTDGINFVLKGSVLGVTSTYSATGLTFGDTYYFKVCSYTGSVESGPTNVVTQTLNLTDPTNLYLTVSAPTQIDLAWGNHIVDLDGYSIERSPDGINYVEIDTTSNLDSYSDNTVVVNSHYFYKVRGYKGVVYTAYTNTADDWTPMQLTFDSAGTGLKCGRFIFYAIDDMSIEVTGTGKLYDDSAGTLNEATTKYLYAGTNNVYLKVPSGSVNINLYGANENLDEFSWQGGALIATDEDADSPVMTNGIASLSASITNCIINSNTTMSGDIKDMPADTEIFWCLGANTLSGDVVDLPVTLEEIRVYGLNTIGGDSADFPTVMTSLDIGGLNGITCDIGDLSEGFIAFQLYGNNISSGNLNTLPSTLIIFGIGGNSTIVGDIADVPVNSSYLKLLGSNHISDYTSGRSWTTNMLLIDHYPDTGFGLTSVEVDNLLIDLAATTWTGALEIKLLGDNAARTAASDVAVASLVAQGVTVTTNP